MRRGAFTSFVEKPRSAVLKSTIILSVFVLLTAFETNTNKPEPPLTLSSAQTDDVQFAIPGDFHAPFDTLNSLPPNGLDLDGNGSIDIRRPCSCRNTFPIPNGSNPNNGLFDDQIVIATGVSGQNWVVGNAYGAYSSANFTPILPGSSIPEIGSTGVYVRPFIHRDAEGYSIEVHNQSDFPGQTFGPVVNTCYYPDPLIENIDDFYCDSEPDVIMIGSATSDFDGNLFPLIPESELWIISREEDGQTFFDQTFSPSEFGDGRYTVRYTFNAGNDPHNADNKTGCAMTVEQDVVVRGNSTLACNAGISVVLSNTNCSVTITPNMLLASYFDDYENFEVEVVDPVGNSLGNVVPAEFANQSLPASVTDLCNGSRCFSTVLVQDIHPPVLTLPADTTLSCTTEPETSLTGMATATDCVGFTITFTDSQQETTCGNPKVVISRSWVATDEFGNSSSAVQTININRANPADLIFPPDVDVSCVDYNANPTIIDANLSGAGQPNLIDEPICGLAYTYSDEVLNICGGPNASQLIIRTWLVIDICGNDYIEVDANGQDNVQVIRIMDNTPPEIQASSVEIVANVPPESNGLDGCSSMGFIPAPVVSDICGDVVDVRIFTPIGEAGYLNGSDGTAGGMVPSPGLQLGTHTITYQAEDACGNTSTLDVEVTVIDNLPPVMICDNSLSLSLESTGFGRIYPADIDEGSSDDCCEDVMLVKLEEEPDSLFREYLEFFCTNDTVNVVLRVYDCFGNYNDCVSSLVVEDRVPPVFVAGSLDASLSCMGDYSDYLDGDFEAPTFEDNCEFTVEFNYEIDFDDCGLGTITRTWTARDNPNNPPAVASQVVTVEPTFDFRIQIPDDVAVSCALLNYDDMIINTEDGCEQIEIMVTEEPYVVVGDTINCYRILRTHQIINWCQYDGVSPPIELPRIDWIDLDTEVGDSYELHATGDTIFRVGPSVEIPIGPATGFYQYQQLIDVFDNEPPSLSFVQQAAFCSLENAGAEDDPCSGVVSFPFTIGDDCSDEFNIFYSLNAFNENNVTDIYGDLDTLAGGKFEINGTYPVGSHSFFVSVFDACGNLNQFTLPFEVVDCTLPTLTCVDVPAFNLQFDGTSNFQPSNLVEFVGDNCSATSLSFSPDSADMMRSFGCDDLGSQTLTVYAMDESGNQSSCSVTFELGDDLNACIDFYMINGNIRTEAGVKIAQSAVNLNGPVQMNYMTDTEGDYAFFDVMEGPGYEIRPEKNDHATNGLSTLDMIFISQHIIGVKLLDSPYKMIAADANRSGTITTLDQIQFRKLILGVDTSFSNNTSWRFIPSEFQFTDTSNPFADEFPEYHWIENLESDTTLDFIAIKVGDVNDSALGNMFAELEERGNPPSSPIIVADRDLSAGEIAEVEFYTGAENLNGCQFTLDFDPRFLELVSIIPNEDVGPANFGLKQQREGLITFSWDAPSGVGQNLTFRLQFKALEALRLSEVIQLNSLTTKAEAYRVDGGTWMISRPELAFYEIEEQPGFDLLQNRPNPFSDRTEIGFVLPEGMSAELTVFDVNNRLIYQTRKHYDAGLNIEKLDKGLLTGNGIYYYRLEIEGAVKVKKMIFIED